MTIRGRNKGFLQCLTIPVALQVERELAQFQACHPPGEGWRIYRTDPEAYVAFSPLLPAFLGFSRKVQLIHENIFTDIGLVDAGKRHIRRSLTEPPFRRRGLGLHEDSWCGDLKFVWQKEEIHVKRVPQYFSNYARDTVTFWAAKKRAVLESLWKALQRFHHSHENPRKNILVLNGQPIPRGAYSWDDIILPGDMREGIRQTVEAFFQAGQRFKNMGLPYRRGILFSGPPGCGKTLTVKVIASTAPAAIFSVNLTSTVDDRLVQRAFERAEMSAPSVLILEDIDKLAASREISLSFLLNLMDGLSRVEGILFVATSNAPEKLDRALLQRPSRFDTVWQFPLPGNTERLKLMIKRAGGSFSDSALREAAASTEGFTMAYVQEVVVSALLRAVHDARPPNDDDLRASATTLRRQFRQREKPLGDLATQKIIGLTGNPDGNGHNY